MKIVLFSFIVIMSFSTFGQNRHLTIGIKNNGICFGNSKKNNGIRLNVSDKETDTINGINLSVFSKATMANGFNLGLITNENKYVNGLLLNVITGESKKLNGVVISGLGYVGEEINGLGIGGFAMTGYKLNGIFLSPIVIGWYNRDKIKIINGFAIGGFGVISNKINGLSISIVQNDVDTLNGVSIALTNRASILSGFQFGLWNVAENNKILKATPIMNVNLRRKKPSR